MCLGICHSENKNIYQQSWKWYAVYCQNSFGPTIEKWTKTEYLNSSTEDFVQKEIYCRLWVLFPSENSLWRSSEPLKTVVIVMWECVTQYVGGWVGNGGLSGPDFVQTDL